MIKKIAVISMVMIVLAGCGILRKQEPKPDAAQTAITDDLSSLMQNLDSFQTSQDDVSDDALLSD